MSHFYTSRDKAYSIFKIIGSHDASATLKTTLKSLYEVLDTWKIRKAVKFLLRDGENKMSAMAEASGYQDFTCFAHTLHLVVGKFDV